MKSDAGLVALKRLLLVSDHVSEAIADLVAEKRVARTSALMCPVGESLDADSPAFGELDAGDPLLRGCSGRGRIIAEMSADTVKMLGHTADINYTLRISPVISSFLRMSTQSFDEALVSRIAPEVRRLRSEKKLSAQKLADRTEEIGFCVSRATITEIEIGRRKYISIGELLVLAAALDVSLLDLVFPGYADTEVEVLPGVFVAKSDTLENFGGSRQLNSRLIAALGASVKVQSGLLEEVEELRREIDRLRNRGEATDGRQR